MQGSDVRKALMQVITWSCVRHLQAHDAAARTRLSALKKVRVAVSRTHIRTSSLLQCVSIFVTSEICLSSKRYTFNLHLGRLGQMISNIWLARASTTVFEYGSETVG